MVGRYTHSHNHFGLVLGAGHAGSVVEKGRLAGAFGRRLVQVPMGESAVVAHRADEVRAFGGTAQFQRHGLFDAGGHHAPFGGLVGIHVGEVEGLPSAVAGGKHGVLGVRRVDFNIEHPVDRRARHIGREGVVVGAGAAVFRRAAEDRLPGGAGVQTAEHVILAAVAIHAAEGAGDQRVGIVRIHRHRGVPERPILCGIGLHGSDVGPSTAVGIVLPDRAIAHPAGAGRSSVSEIQDPIRRHYHMGGPVLGWLSGHRRPRLARVVRAEQILPAHQRNRDISG